MQRLISHDPVLGGLRCGSEEKKKEHKAPGKRVRNVTQWCTVCLEAERSVWKGSVLRVFLCSVFFRRYSGQAECLSCSPLKVSLPPQSFHLSETGSCHGGVQAGLDGTHCVDHASL